MIVYKLILESVHSDGFNNYESFLWVKQKESDQCRSDTRGKFVFATHKKLLQNYWVESSKFD